MKHQNLQKGKKLSKKELKTIIGGLLDCMQPILCQEYPCYPIPPDDPSACTMISPRCAQKICRP